MSTTLIPISNRKSSPVTANGNLCGIFTEKRTSGVMAIGIVSILAACSIHSTVKMGDAVIAETTESDLQAALTNVVQPFQTAAALESRVTYVPSYWYNEDAAIVCQVGEYCIKLESK